MADTRAGEGIWGAFGMVGGGTTTRGAEETGMVTGLIEVSAGAAPGFFSLSSSVKSHFSAKKIPQTIATGSASGASVAISGTVCFVFTILLNFAVLDSFPR